ncbi:MAG: nitrous oxide reductase family maturation protein NosD [Magnetospirillum sp.]|nr:nitrous oxide reductase family maturation protein NosD [Magnetospirillum sp.]
MRLAVALLAMAAPAAATETRVPPAPGALAAVIAAARPGDTLVLAAGMHRGGVTLDRPLTLAGEPGATVDGGGRGTVIRIVAPDVTVRGLTVRHSGSRQEEIDSAIYADRGADRAVIEDNRIEASLFGVSLRGARDAVARRNVVVGRTDLRTNDRGDAFSVWNAPGARVEDNRASGGRDGIRSTASRDNVFAGNRFRNVRFAVHTMWSDGETVAGNRSEGNDLGFALMYSRRITAETNVSAGDRDYGMLVNSTDRSTFAGNRVAGANKCVFIYSATNNLFRDNRFSACAIGVHFTAGSEGNRFTGNAFAANRTQVMYVGTRALDWSVEGRGNYWSDNPAFDLDGDGIADAAYRPNDVVDRLVWAVPTVKLLLNSPAVAVLRLAQSNFPAVTPGGVIDSAPLMRPPP